MGLDLVPDFVNVSIPDAKSMLWRGLCYFLQGNKPKWLESYNEIADWMGGNKGKGLLLAGNCGLGKSVICTKVLPILLNHYHNLIVETFVGTRINANAAAIMRRKAVVIDDIGIEDIANDYGEKHAFMPEIVDNAERNGNMLILTTNLTPDELRAKYGERTYDRLTAITRLVLMSGKSMRG